MELENRLEINFHQQEEASVYFESTNTGEDDQQGALFHFSLYAMRQMVNLAGEIGMTLGQALTMIQENYLMAKTLLDKHEVKLIEYPGHPGMKRFISEFSFKESGGLRFNLNMKGFGFLGLGGGQGYYGPNSVFVLLKYFYSKNVNNPKFLKKLAQVATGCGSVYVSGRVGVMNQQEYAMAVVGAAISGPELDKEGLN